MGFWLLYPARNFSVVVFDREYSCNSSCFCTSGIAVMVNDRLDGRAQSFLLRRARTRGVVSCGSCRSARATFGGGSTSGFRCVPLGVRKTREVLFGVVSVCRDYHVGVIWQIPSFVFLFFDKLYRVPFRPSAAASGPACSCRVIFPILNLLSPVNELQLVRMGILLPIFFSACSAVPYAVDFSISFVCDK